MIDKHYSLAEISDRLSLSTATLLRHINKDKIKAVKICGVWRISQTELNRLTGAAAETVKPKSARERFNELNVRHIDGK